MPSDAIATEAEVELYPGRLPPELVKVTLPVAARGFLAFACETPTGWASSPKSVPNGYVPEATEMMLPEASKE